MTLLIFLAKFSILERVWHVGYEPFAKIGHDTFILVTPVGNCIWTCEAEVIQQIHSRSFKFIKPVEM